MKLHRLKRKHNPCLLGAELPPDVQISVKVLGDLPKPKIRLRFFKTVHPIPDVGFYFRDEVS